MFDLLALIITAIIGFYGAIVATAAVRGARRLRLEQTNPEIAVYLESHPDSPSIVQLVVHNIGQGPAHHIRFKTTAGVIPQVLVPDMKMHIFEDQLQFLAPGKSLRFSIGQWFTISDDAFTVETSYYKHEADDGHHKKTLTSTYTMDPKQSKGLTNIDDTKRQSEKAIIKAMKALEGGKVIVNVRDQDVIDEKNAEYYRQMESGITGEEADRLYNELVDSLVAPDENQEEEPAPIPLSKGTGSG